MRPTVAPKTLAREQPQAQKLLRTPGTTTAAPSTAQTRGTATPSFVVTLQQQLAAGGDWGRGASARLEPATVEEGRHLMEPGAGETAEESPLRSTNSAKSRTARKESATTPRLSPHARRKRCAEAPRLSPHVRRKRSAECSSISNGQSIPVDARTWTAAQHHRRPPVLRRPATASQQHSRAAAGRHPHYSAHADATRQHCHSSPLAAPQWQRHAVAAP